MASQSGVSLRSVYRYVSSREQLFEQAIARHLKRTANLWLADEPTERSLSGRIDHFLEHRLRLYEAVAATNRASRAFSLTHTNIQEKLTQGRQLLHDQTARQFAPEFSDLPTAQRRRVLVALDTLTQLEGLDSLVYIQQCSIREARETLHHTISLLLTESLKGNA